MSVYRPVSCEIQVQSNLGYFAFSDKRYGSVYTTFMNLSQKKCIPCEAGTSPLTAVQIGEYQSQTPEWQVVENRQIRRNFRFKNFVEAMEFINRVAIIAEEQGHHPDLHIFYNQVTIELWTHAIGGLSENDFIVASKIDALTN